MNANIISQLIVRVIAKGGKFLGDDINGATVSVRHAITNELLASGKTQGGSGDIWQLMIQPRSRRQPLPVDGASLFTATIQSTDCSPIPVMVSATGPGAGLQSMAEASAMLWLVPGLVNPFTGLPTVFNCTLELNGLIVQAMQPSTHLNVPKLPQLINFEVNVAMMCGCPIDNNSVTDGTNTFANPWPASDFYVGCDIVCSGQIKQHLQLTYNAIQGPGTYRGSWTMIQPGFYTGHIIAHQISNGNTGCASVSFFNIAAG